MTFGFPAYHTERYAPADPADLRQVVEVVLGELSWSVRERKPDEILASTSISLSSWGEKVVITFAQDNCITVTSKCALPTQCVDWGKNKANVAKFMAALGKHSTATP